MTSSVERGMASTTTHVTGTIFLFEMDVLHVVVIGVTSTRQVLRGRPYETMVSMTTGT